MRYAVVIEKSESNFSAYVPDLPRCIATGATIAEVESEIREAIAFQSDKEVYHRICRLLSPPRFPPR
ncbi:type II toxin-antitoxin system HicB family antitoxin, partial [Thiohalocapsa halophila]|uniref:type II toxin-antitoxin system HicB family antitoxin n=1 Tax=Thiohalocapsa halophila TaxID=69359 RepID=UPI001F5B08CA